MFLTNFLLPDILQYILNLYIDHQRDVHIVQKSTNNFIFDLKPFTKIEMRLFNDKKMEIEKYVFIEEEKNMLEAEYIFVDDLKFKITYYYKNGNKSGEINFLLGIIEGKVHRWYKNGNIKEMIEFKNGIRDGECLTYYENGKLKEINKFKIDKMNGECIIFYKNGNIMYKLVYTNNKLDGLCKKYTDKGIIEIAVTWEAVRKNGPTYIDDEKGENPIIIIYEHNFNI
jgi:antitoxin component YwqK of YwqJK toxin-antitoxin module